LDELKNKAKDIIAKHPKYTTEFKELSLEDMSLKLLPRHRI